MQITKFSAKEIPALTGGEIFSLWRTKVNLKHPVSIGIIVFLAAVLFLSPTDNMRWDPSFYYAQLRAPVVDNTLNFRNETDTGGIQTVVTATGLQQSPWPVGPSILWSPFFLAAHAAVKLIAPDLSTGFTFPYIVFVTAGSSFFGLTGLGLVFLIARRFSNPFLALLAAFLALTATPLAYYIFRQPLMAHTTSLAAGAALILTYLTFDEGQIPRQKSGIYLGVLLGLNFLTRWSGVWFGIFPIAYFAGWIFGEYRARRWSKLRDAFIQVVVFSGSFLLIITPQLALWQRLHNKWFVSPQGASTFVEGFFPVNLSNIFLHTNRGLLFWAPFLFLSLVGLFRITNKKYRLLFITYMVAVLVLISYRVDWFSGGGFGARYFIETLPVLVVGFVSLWKGIPLTRGLRLSLVCLAAILALHQMVLVFATEHSPTLAWIDLRQYLAGEPLGLRFQLISIVKLLNDPQLWLLPHPYVSLERQAIIVNLLQGERRVGAYLVPGLSAVFLAMFASFGAWIFPKLKSYHLTPISLIVIVYMLGWAVFYLLVGRV